MAKNEPPDGVHYDPETNRVTFTLSTGDKFELPALPNEAVLDALFDMASVPRPGESETDVIQRYQETFENIEYLRNLHNSPEARESLYRQQHWNNDDWTWYNYGPGGKPSLTQLSPKLAKDIEENNARARGLEKTFELASSPVASKGEHQQEWKAFFRALAYYGITQDAFDWEGFRESYNKENP